MPFTTDEFFGAFGLYNRTFVGVVVALWLASIAALAFVARYPGRRSPTLSGFLGALWLWNAGAYHLLFFTRINRAAWLFAIVFVVQAVLFFWTAARSEIRYFSSTGWRRRIGTGLMVYALGYPFLTIALGHRYPEAPTFGVPCPTTILTIGVLMTVCGRVPLILAVIPIVWGFIGGSAAILLAVPTDYVLLGAGVLLTVMLLGRRVRPASAER